MNELIEDLILSIAHILQNVDQGFHLALEICIIFLNKIEFLFVDLIFPISFLFGLFEIAEERVPNIADEIHEKEIEGVFHKQDVDHIFRFVAERDSVSTGRLFKGFGGFVDGNFSVFSQVTGFGRVVEGLGGSADMMFFGVGGDCPLGAFVASYDCGRG